MTVDDALDLLDWKRRVFDLYAGVRAAHDPEAAWRAWREARDALFREHPQTPLDPGDRQRFRGLAYFDYDPALRVTATLHAAPELAEALPVSRDEPIHFRWLATARFALAGQPQQLDLYWLDSYGGGLFLPFRDGTSGGETYGGGRYLLDSVKGADLGTDAGSPVLDFNFAYNPSCAYDPRWACPLAPPGNRLDVPVPVGELSGAP